MAEILQAPRRVARAIRRAWRALFFDYEAARDACVEAIEFAIDGDTDDGLEFLREWNEGAVTIDDWGRGGVRGWDDYEEMDDRDG